MLGLGAGLRVLGLKLSALGSMPFSSSTTGPYVTIAHGSQILGI